ncbi:hypothetical protein D516_3234 [Rhodobacter sp. AKP1]|nr:hypothetical protein D516_3234 [Rhodobacter sp. AKP1]
MGDGDLSQSGQRFRPARAEEVGCGLQEELDRAIGPLGGRIAL